MGKKLIPLFIAVLLITGACTSCRHDITSAHGCDTCKKPCDTCKMDTTHHGCDTCNINKDSAAHAFTWKEFAIPGETNLTGVWVFGPNDMIIVGGSLWHFDGTNFTDLHPFYNGADIDGALSGFNIFAFSQTDYWLVHGSIAFHTSDGKNFDQYRKGSVNACWGTSSNDMFFVGNGGNIFHFDGKKFDSMASNTTQDLQSIWGTDDNHVWACGQNNTSGKSAILFFDGNNWSIDNLTNDPKAQYSGLDVTWAKDSTGSHRVVITTGAYAFRKTDDLLWRVDTTIPNKAKDGFVYVMYVLSANSANDVFVSSDYNWIGHWNGKTWKSYDSLIFDSGFSKADAISVKDNTVCVVGAKKGNSWVAVGTRKE